MPWSWLVSIVGIFLAVAYALIILAEWRWSAISQAHAFLGEVKTELKKVTWPAKREVWGTTGVVIATVFFFGIFLSLVDFLVTMGRTGIFHAVGISRGPTP